MDRISALPQDTIEKILTLMPLRDAGRTSILSRKWRYCWTSMPRLAFDVIYVSSNNKEFNKHKLIKDIFHVLILHTGPILEFSICINDSEIADGFDPIILHLSRSHNIKKFHFLKWSFGSYKLPFCFFSLQGLEHLDLRGCIINIPLMFNGFSMLRSLWFCHCMITAEMLQRFLTKCPMLEELTLDLTYSIEVKMNTFVELFKCLSSVQDFAAYGDMPQKLSTPLVHLRILFFDVCFGLPDEVSCLFCVINSSPNLEKIKLEMRWGQEQDFGNMFDIEDHSNLILDHLKELEITNFRNVENEMDFVKLIMAKSPVLKLARLELNPCVDADDEFKMLRDLVRLPFPRASPTANLIIERMA